MRTTSKTANADRNIACGNIVLLVRSEQSLNPSGQGGCVQKGCGGDEGNVEGGLDERPDTDYSEGVVSVRAGESGVGKEVWGAG